MGIAGISEQRRLPRFGKIRTGMKVPTGSGKERPKETHYFVFNPIEQIVDLKGNVTGQRTNTHIQALIKLFGEQPTELPIVLALGQKKQNGDWADAPQNLKWYAKDTNSRSMLMCKGNGEFAVYKGKQKVPGQDDPNVQYPLGYNRKCSLNVCPQRQPDKYGNCKCKPIMNFMFLIPTYSMMGTFVIDTSSLTAMIDINSALDLADKAYMYELIQRRLIAHPGEYRGLSGVPLIIKRVAVPNSKGGSNYPIKLEVDVSQLKEGFKAIAAGQASTLQIGFSGAVVLEPQNELDVDQSIVDPHGQMDVVDSSTGEIIGSTGSLENKQQVSTDANKTLANDPAVIKLFDELSRLKDREHTEGGRVLTANKFANDPQQRNKLMQYLEDQILQARPVVEDPPPASTENQPQDSGAGLV